MRHLPFTLFEPVVDTTATVPEPGALVLALLAVLSLAGTVPVPSLRERPRHRDGGG